MDYVSKEIRSRMMSSVRSKSTTNEVLIRKSLFHLGLRYGLHNKNLPGRPDIVLRRHRTAVFVNGCFWHMHGCHLSSIPKTRVDWWRDKLMSNKARDILNYKKLLSMHWRVAIIWDCALKGKNGLTAEFIALKLQSFLIDDVSVICCGGRGITYPTNIEGVYYG